MHSIVRSASAACAATLFVAGAARAQRPSRVELGIDAALTHVSVDVDPGSASYNVFNFPVQAIRAGFELTPLVSIEPVLGVQSFSGDRSLTQLNFDIGLPINLSGPMNPAATQAFLRPLVGFRHVSGGGNGETQTALGVGIGMRVPITARFNWRFEARYAHGLDGDDTPATNELGLLAGISFFTR